MRRRLIWCGMAGAAVLGIVVTLLAFRADRVESRAQSTIDAVPFEVWPFLVDPDVRRDWMDGVTNAARMTGVPGQRGSSMMMNLKVDQFTMNVFEDVVAADYPSRLETRTTDNLGTLSVETTYTLTFEDDRTVVSVVQTRDLSGTWAVWFAPFIQTRADAQLQGNLDRLKALVNRREEPP